MSDMRMRNVSEDLGHRPSSTPAPASVSVAEPGRHYEAVLTERGAQLRARSLPGLPRVVSRHACGCARRPRCGPRFRLWEAARQWKSPWGLGVLVIVSRPKDNDRKTADARYGDDHAEIAQTQGRVMFALLLLRAAHMGGAAIR